MSAAGGDSVLAHQPMNQSAIVHLKVNDQDGKVMFFSIYRSILLKKLMKIYCNKRSVEMNSIVFLYHGIRLEEEQTPDELGMQNGDKIDTVLKH